MSAHELGRTRDRVVACSYDDHPREGQHPVVAESGAPLAGVGVGREREGRARCAGGDGG